MTESAAPYFVSPASIDWRSPDTPASTAHGDIYWSPGAGLDEKQHVFIQGNNLVARWQSTDGIHFTICEVGFGFGLNFLLTANLWRRSAPKRSVLNYIAIERSPVSQQDLSSLLDSLPGSNGVDPDTFARHRHNLATHYPLLTPGLHSLWIDVDICLLLYIGSAEHAMDNLDARIDAWYLDGFSPSANADAWHARLFEAMPDMSRPGATVATYSVAGRVRRSLTDNGFEIERRAGFGNKSEMLTARMKGSWQPAALQGGRVAVVGGGIAGLFTARALARRHIAVDLIEVREQLLGGASSIPALAVYPGLSVRPEVRSLFSLAAFDYAMNFGDATKVTGRCQVPKSPDEALRLERIVGALPEHFGQLSGPGEVLSLTGAKTDYPCLYLPTAGTLHPAELCEDLAGITLRTGRRVTSITSQRITFEDGETSAYDAVVLAPGASEMPLLAPFGFVAARGQSIAVNLKCDLPHALGGDVSALPFGDRTAIVGSTYNQYSTDASIRDQDSAALLSKLSSLGFSDATLVDAWAGIRCTTRDRSPVVGPVPDWARLASFCEETESGPCHAETSGLFITTGFGSHGATHSALAGEHIARLVTGEASCLTGDWIAHLAPARFALRDAGRRTAIPRVRPR